MANSGGISNITVIGGYNVSEDVIEMTSEIVSSEAEASENSGCKITLSNGKLKYGKIIAQGGFIPEKSKIQSYVIVEKNDSNGEVYTIVYTFFVGIVNEVSYNHETCTIEGICDSGTTVPSCKDHSWTDKYTFKEKVQDIVNDIYDQTGTFFIVKDTMSSPGLKVAGHIASGTSFLEALRKCAQDSSKDFRFECDNFLEAGDESAGGIIILCDNNSYTNIFELDPYVLDPGDNTAIIGYANWISVIGENSTGEELKANVPDTQKQNVIYVYQNEESIDKYGNKAAPQIWAPRLYKIEDIKQRAEDLGEWYERFEDRNIKVTVAELVPLVQSNVVYNITSPETGDQVAIKAGINRKRVSYSSSGIITELECKLDVRELSYDSEKESEKETSDSENKNIDYVGQSGLNYNNPFDIDTTSPYSTSGEKMVQWIYDKIYGKKYATIKSGLSDSTDLYTFILDKSGHVYYTIGDESINLKKSIDSAPDSIKNIFSKYSDTLLENAQSEWGNDFSW